jgi:hypothetical protein
MQSYEYFLQEVSFACRELKGMSAPHIPNARHPSQPAQTFQSPTAIAFGDEPLD